MFFTNYDYNSDMCNNSHIITRIQQFPFAFIVSKTKPQT